MLHLGFLNYYEYLNFVWKKSLYFFFYFSVFLHNNFVFDFIKTQNLFILNLKKTYIYTFYLPSFFFLKNKKNLIILMFLKKYYFFSFIKFLFSSYIYCKNIYFFRLKLKGLGFFVKRINKYFLCFFMALNHFFYFHLADFVYLKKKKKHFIFLSNNKEKLNIIFWNLMFLKKHNVYVKIKGISGFVKPNLVRFIKKKNKL